MERLTFDGNFCDIAQCRALPCPYGNSCTQRRVWERLKAYEDTGLSPEQCADYAKSGAIVTRHPPTSKAHELTCADVPDLVSLLRETPKDVKGDDEVNDRTT